MTGGGTVTVFGDVLDTADGAAMREALATCLLTDEREDARRIVEALAPGERPDWEDEYGTTVLISASGYGRLEICELLVAAGADPEHRDQFGRTAAAVFGAHADDELMVKQPSERLCGRARKFFAASGKGAEMPQEHVLSVRDRVAYGSRGARPEGEEREKLKEFHLVLLAELGSRGLPRFYYEPETVHRARVWLLASEVVAVWEAVRTGVAAAKISGDYSLDLAGAGGKG